MDRAAHHQDSRQGETSCVLCGSEDTAAFARVLGRSYLRCAGCELVFMAAGDRLDAASERAVYLLHENDVHDAGYRGFLDRLAGPLVERLPDGACGLDFGCGPGPALAAMLQERGFPTAVYDPFFAPDGAALQRQYDFIVCSEAAEHFHAPGAEFVRLAGLLTPGGWLGLMTRWRDPEADFSNWHYVRDPTHVCFYHPHTLQWLAQRHGWQLHCAAPHVALFQSDAAQPAQQQGR